MKWDGIIMFKKNDVLFILIISTLVLVITIFIIFKEHNSSTVTSQNSDITSTTNEITIYEDFIYIFKNDLIYYETAEKIVFPIVVMVNNDQPITSFDVSYINSNTDELNHQIKEVYDAFAHHSYSYFNEERNVKTYTCYVVFDESVESIQVNKVGIKLNGNPVEEVDIGNITITKVINPTEDLFIDIIGGYLNDQIEYVKSCSNNNCFQSKRNIGNEANLTLHNKRMYDIDIINLEIVNSINSDVSFVSNSNNILEPNLTLKPYEDIFIQTTGYSNNITVSNYQIKAIYMIEEEEKINYSNEILFRPIANNDFVDYIAKEVLNSKEVQND